MNKIYYLKLLLPFVILYHMYIVIWGFIPWKKVSFLLACFPLQKELGRSSYDVASTHYDKVT